MKNGFLRRILPLAIASLLVLADQITKRYIMGNYALHESRPIIDCVLNFTYVQNTGAAGGILSEHRWIFMSITAVIVVVCLIAVLSGKIRSRLMMTALTLVLAGGTGNMLDRVFRGFVVDFIDVKFSILDGFFVFNFADCCVVIGVIFAMIYFIADMADTSVKKNRRSNRNGRM